MMQPLECHGEGKRWQAGFRAVEGDVQCYRVSRWRWAVPAEMVGKLGSLRSSTKSGIQYITTVEALISRGASLGRVLKLVPIRIVGQAYVHNQRVSYNQSFRTPFLQIAGWTPPTSTCRL